MVSPDISKLTYRDNVSCVVFKGNKFLLVQLVEWPDNWWKFPQGGIEEGESEEEAVRRELLEELEIKNFKMIAKSSHTNQYEWSDFALQLAGYRWRGQIQKFFLVEYLGTDKEIKINKKEIQQYKWVDLKNLFFSIDHDDKIFTNYKNTIEKVLEEFNLI